MREESPQLVERLRAGEPAAFREMVECYQRAIFVLAYDLCGNRRRPRKRYEIC